MVNFSTIVLEGSRDSSTGANVLERTFTFPADLEPLPRRIIISYKDTLGFLRKDSTNDPDTFPQLENSFKERGETSMEPLVILLANSPQPVGDKTDLLRLILTSSS